MGMTIDRYLYSGNEITSGLIVFCNEARAGRLELAVSVNQYIANELLKVKSKNKTMILESVLLGLLKTLPDNSMLKDIDVLFNPIYKIDVMRLLTSVSKRKPFQVIWSGILDGDKLIYGEPGYFDYKVFDLNSYDVICVK